MAGEVAGRHCGKAGELHVLLPAGDEPAGERDPFADSAAVP